MAVAAPGLGHPVGAEPPCVGRSPDRGQSDIPLSELPEGKAIGLTRAKEGAGRLYYRLGLSYAPASLKVDPLERGFSVSRSYEAVDDPGDVRRTADGGWEVQAGSRVRFTSYNGFDVGLLRPLPGVTQVEQNGRQITVHGSGPLLSHVVSALNSQNLAPADLSVEQANLEDVFLALTGRQIRD
mgnify:CR=1 FL=1